MAPAASGPDGFRGPSGPSGPSGSRGPSGPDGRGRGHVGMQPPSLPVTPPVTFARSSVSSVVMVILLMLGGDHAMVVCGAGG